MNTTASSRDHGATRQALLAAIERRGLTLFAEIDHAAAAREVGMELGEETVLLFGNPRGGTPLMQSDRRVGIELPLRILIWSDHDRTMLGHRDPRELGGAYELQGHESTLEQMAGLLEQLVNEAAS